MVAKNTALYYRRGLYYRGFHEVCTIASLAITPLIFLPSYTKLEGAPPLRRVFPGTRSSYCMEHIRLHFPDDLFGTVGRLPTNPSDLANIRNGLEIRLRNRIGSSLKGSRLPAETPPLFSGGSIPLRPPRVLHRHDQGFRGRWPALETEIICG